MKLYIPAHSDSEKISFFKMGDGKIKAYTKEKYAWDSIQNSFENSVITIFVSTKDTIDTYSIFN